MPALLNATSRPPYAWTAESNIAATCSSSVTSTWTNSPLTASAARLPPSGAMSAQTTCAPAPAKRRAVARPMPLAAPVITATRPSSRFMRTPSGGWSGGGGQEDVLRLGERVDRVGAELSTQPRLLEAAERRGVAHRRMAVDRQVPG